jgi:nucleoside-diphosphate-sugar epimerase
MALSTEDLAHVRMHTQDVWTCMQNKRIFLTGGTGFFGCWLIESFLHANNFLDLDCELVVLTRNSSRFREKAPHLVADPALKLLEGSLQDFQTPPGRFDYLIHAAATTSLLSMQALVTTLDEEISALQRILAFAGGAGVKRVLFTSSGAVYGAQQTGDAIAESAPCNLDPANTESVYGELKRLGELYSVCSAHRFGFEVVLARCFSVFGPYQDLNAHFAAANFMRDILAGQDIVVQGDGLDQRSYLYAADLAVWLWRLLVFGESCVPYNVGSPVPVSILQLAKAIAHIAGGDRKVCVLGKPRRGLAPQSYVPNVEKANRELGLEQLIDIEDGIRRTIMWNRYEQSL